MLKGIKRAMKTYTINTLGNYRKWEQWFYDNGYEPWQYQYRWNAPEGLHVRFAKSGQEDIEIVTRNEEVHKAIMGYNSAK